MFHPETKEVDMCYEYLRFQRMRAEEESAKPRTKEWLDKARSARPVPVQDEPVMTEQDQEAVEA
jgi:hypothetical protein